jgi:hypothetical protein
MNISTLTPVKTLNKAEEVSQLRSPRDSATIYSAWKRENELVKGINATMQVVNQLARELKRLGGRITQDFDFFPFKIYNLPDEFKLSASSSINWRTLNVRGGYVLTSKIDSGSCYVNGTDRMEHFAYHNFLHNPISLGQYIIPTGSYNYFFWIETSGSASPDTSSYYLRSSATPQTPDSLLNPNGWTNWPSASSGNYIIGFVDTATSAAAHIALVRQVQVGDILSSGLPDAKQFTVCENGSLDTWFLYGYKSGSAP